MPTLTEDKKENIWKTYQNTKSFSETAKIERVDARTVRKVVLEKKAKLAVTHRADSPEAKAAKPAGNRILDPDRKVQLKAYDLFDRGRTNIQVSQELKLSSSEIIRYRGEYNDMKKADYDEELEQRKREKTRLEGIKQQLEGELLSHKSELNRTRKDLKDDQENLRQLQPSINELSGVQ